MNERSKDALGYGQLTCTGVVTIASAFTIPAGTELVKLQAEAQNIRYRDDGTDPTSTVGMILVVNTLYEFQVAQFARMRIIEAAATGKLNVSAYGLKTA